MEILDRLNGFQTTIYEYIHAYHPYMLEDEEELKEVIIIRAENAKKAYLDAEERGESPLECEHTASQALHAGLEFSPVTYLNELCYNVYGYDLSNDEACAIYLNREVKDIFSKYGTEIEGDPREMELIEELKPFIKRYEAKGDLSKKLIDVWNIPIEYE
jgi:hypothetical protein